MVANKQHSGSSKVPASSSEQEKPKSRSSIDYLKHRGSILVRKSIHYRDVEGPRRRAERKEGKEVREKEMERKILEQAGGDVERAQELLEQRKRKNEGRKRRHEKKKAEEAAGSSAP